MTSCPCYQHCIWETQYLITSYHWGEPYMWSHNDSAITKYPLDGCRCCQYWLHFHSKLEQFRQLCHVLYPEQLTFIYVISALTHAKYFWYSASIKRGCFADEVETEAEERVYLCKRFGILHFCVVVYQVENMGESVIILLLPIRWQPSVFLEPLTLELSLCFIRRATACRHIFPPYFVALFLPQMFWKQTRAYWVHSNQLSK